MAATGSDPRAPVEIPAELTPKRGPGRPPGSANKPKTDPKVPELSHRTLAAAYQGLWLVLRLCTWIVAGREKSPVAQATRATWYLEDLDADEATQDARDLLPFVLEIGPLVRVLAWIGAPVIVVKRISGKLRRKTPATPSVSVCRVCGFAADSLRHKPSEPDSHVFEARAA